MEKIKEALKQLINGTEESLRHYFLINKDTLKYKNSSAVFNYRVYDCKEGVNFITISITAFCKIWNKDVRFEVCDNIPLHEISGPEGEKRINRILGQILSTLLIRIINYDDAS